MKKIVTIDFDVIMAPSISFYNGLVPQWDWDTLLTYPTAQLFEADFALYHHLTDYVGFLTEHLEANQITFVTDHHQVLDFLDDTEIYDVINIDHHHDLGYNKSAEKDAPLDCSNWVKVLSDNKQCSSYLWITNENAEYEDNIICDTKILRETTLIDLDIPDQLFIVLSPPWVPPHYLYLVDCWMVMLNTIYKTKFELH